MSETRDTNGQPPDASSLPPSSSVAGDEEGGEEMRRQRQQQQQQYTQRNGGKKRIRKVGGMVMVPFRRINNLYSTRIKNTSNQCASSSSTSSSYSSSSSYPRYYGERPIPRCYFCFMRPPVESDLPTVEIANNPSDPDPSTYGYVRNLIDKNDFYSADCNVHRDCKCPQRCESRSGV